MNFNLTAIWTWIKDKAIWAYQHWWIILIILLGILIVIWLIKRLIIGIKNDNY